MEAAFRSFSYELRSETEIRYLALAHNASDLVFDAPMVVFRCSRAYVARSSAAGSNVVEICCMAPLRRLAPTSMRGTMMVADDLVGRPRRGMRIWTLLLARLVGVSKRSARACLTRAHDASDWADDQAERARASAPKHVSN